MRDIPEDFILKLIVPLKEMFKEGTRLLQERSGRQGLFDSIMQNSKKSRFN
jgi:GMP synthase PP-ATPase subunit